MDERQTICLLNDSFPPLIDGVANTVLNYAKVINEQYRKPIVITPNYPGCDDSSYPYPVVRYPSIDLRDKTGYMAGIPFAPDVNKALSGRKISLLHAHCPIVSTMLARELRQIYDVPLILTYHTKFDIDIANIIKSKTLQDIGKRALLENINGCDEVWAVSRGAAENLRALGYEGDCIIMQNGVDLPCGKVDDDLIENTVKLYDLPENVPVFLFVGRIMWYKGLKIIADGLAKISAVGKDFRMVFIGQGADCDALKSYIQSIGIYSKCIFTGAIHNRDQLRAWYCRSDLFLFPSTFDTNGLVVREAAACSLASVLIRGSCAAEDIVDGQNGFLIEENADSMYACLRSLLDKPERMRHVGETASKEIYISWETAIQKALERYEIVIDRYNSGVVPAHHRPIEHFFRARGELMEGLAHIQTIRHNMRVQFSEHFSEQLDHFKDIIQ